MVEKQSKRILPQLFSCIQKQKDINSKITLLEHGSCGRFS